MALPKETLDEIKSGLDKAAQGIKSVEETVSDLRASGIDASAQEAELKEAKDKFRQMQMFYNLQIRRSS